MDYLKYIKFDDDWKLYRLDCEACKGMSWDDLSKIVERINYLNGQIIDKLKKNVSTTDVLLDRNVDRSLAKTNVCIRVPTYLVNEIREFAGRLNVPASDFMCYVLKYGYLSYREIEEL